MSKKIRTPFAAILLLVLFLLQIFQVIFLKGFFNFTSILTVLINLVLCGVLFAKQYNNIVVIVLGCQTLISLINLVRYFSLINLLDFAAHALLTVFTLAVCEQTLVKADLSKVKEIVNKLFYLPAIVYLVSSVWYFIMLTSLGGTFAVLHILNMLLYGIVLLNLGMWLKDPYSKEEPMTTAERTCTNNVEEQGEAYCGLGKHILLLLFTFGIWYLIWIYRTTKYLNKTPNVKYYNPTTKLLLCIFVPFYSIYWLYKHGQRIDSFSKAKGLNNSDMATLCLILGIFIPIVACIIMQDKINNLCTAKAETATPQGKPQTADELKKYKELLDNGVITQEEFDAKKKQLLGL